MKTNSIVPASWAADHRAVGHRAVHHRAVDVLVDRGSEAACNRGLRPLWRRDVPTPILTFLLLVFGFSLFAETLALQSFESSVNDTWSYTANPTPDSKRIWWGPTTEAMGGATAYSGTYYWAGWDLDNVECTLSFQSIPLNPNINYQIRFWYYTRNLNTTGDFSRYSIMNDQGTVWTNWIVLSNNTNAWTEVTSDVPSGSNFVRLCLSSKFDGSTKYSHWDKITLSQPDPMPPLVTNVTAIQRTDGSKIVDINYDLYDANDDLCGIILKLSNNNGVSYELIPSPTNLSGDFGDDLPSGTDKHIVWNAGAESFTLDGSYLYRVYADDGTFPIPENFVFVEGGTFNNGTSDVTISSFYIDKCELTQAGYQAVMGSNPAYNHGVGSTYPVNNVSWFNAIEYCNRRSIQEGLTPCFSYSTYGTNPDNWPGGWNTDDGNHTNVSCNWTANGYRLPTEMEWQFAARGGNQTHNYTYSGSNDQNAVGWYTSNSGNTTHTVGTKAANELSTFDMSGNVWEWVWDIPGSYPSGNQTDPHGANSGSSRVLRGGSWDFDAYYCTVSYRNVNYAASAGYNVGFRCVRVSP